MADFTIHDADWYIARRPCPGANHEDLVRLVNSVRQHLFHQFATVEAFDLLGQFLDDGEECDPLELPGDFAAPGQDPLDLGLPGPGRIDRGFGGLGDEESPGPLRE